MPSVSGFLPSTSAPLFRNGPWPPGLDLRVSVAGLPALSVDVTNMGLCGGMVFLTRDIHESGTPQLRCTQPRRLPLALGRYIFGRLLDSFVGPGVIPYWIHATQELDHGTRFWGRGLYAETVDAAHQVMRYVDAGGLVPIGVVLAQSAWPWDVFQNHVELVYGYELDGTELTLHVYDCNLAGRDDVTVTLNIGSTAPARPIRTTGTSMKSRPGRIRGFFVMPYQHKDPSAAYVDAGSVAVVGDVPPRVAPAESLSLTVTIANTGSTTFDPARGYRLGVPSQPDGTGWAPVRAELAEAVDPGRTITQAITLRTPLRGWPPLRLQLRREPDVWVGQPSPPVHVSVAAPSRSPAR